MIEIEDLVGSHIVVRRRLYGDGNVIELCESGPCPRNRGRCRYSVNTVVSRVKCARQAIRTSRVCQKNTAGVPREAKVKVKLKVICPADGAETNSCILCSALRVREARNCERGLACCRRNLLQVLAVWPAIGLVEGVHRLWPNNVEEVTGCGNLRVAYCRKRVQV